MGRPGKWLRSLFSASKQSSPPPAKDKSKARWFAPKSGDESLATSRYGTEDQLDANKHAIAVAAATAAVAEAALAAAQAAAEVVRLTSGSGSGRNDGPAYVGGDRRRVAAAVKIQSAFRAYLARRALRALKGLVKLQALVRGHIVRKQSADMLRRMQAMARIQARASAHRSYLPEPITRFNNPRHPGIMNRRKYDLHSNNAKQGVSIIKQRYNPRSLNSGGVNNESSNQTSNWLHHWMDQYAWSTRHGDDERNDKILEIDTWKPRQPTRRTDRTAISTPQYFSWNDAARLSAKLQKPNPSISSEEVSSALSPKYPPEGDQGAVFTAENSPRVHSASSRQSRGPFTPTKSECSRSLFGDYLSHPSYMANTASSRAKVRSQSAPKQRMQLQELGMSHGLWEPDTNSEKGFPLPGNYRDNTYLQYSGQLRRQGTPARGAYTGFSSTYAPGL